MELTKDLHELPVRDILNRFRGRNLTVSLINGQQLTGKIREGVDYTAALTRQVHLTELEGREFFDAVVAIDAIVYVQFRRPDNAF